MTTRDSEDLHLYASHGDEAAFRRIVERHAPMVHGVAWRRMRDRALAEDVTQSVFVILARKARSIPHQELAAWLYRTAFMETLNASRKEAKRRQALTDYTAMTPDTGPEWAEIAPHLDEVICQLPAADRQLVVMRYFEERDYAEIRHLTGRSEQASRKQMQRALDRLGSLLRRRGVRASSGTALGAILAGQTLCTPPASAAVIASVALQSLPAVAAATGSASFISTLSFMTTQTALKTTAAVLILAAIPTAILLNRTDDASVKTPSATTSASGNGYGTDATNPAATTNAPDLPAREGARKTQNRPDRSSTAKNGDRVFPDGMMKIERVDWTEGVRKKSSRLSSRLATRLNLTPDQQTKLSAYLAEQDRKVTEMLNKQMNDGTLALASADGPLRLSPGLIDVAVPKSDGEFDNFLNGLLTPEQQAINNTFREQERQENVRREAQEQIDELSRYVDLSAEQKQQIFDQAEQRSQKTGSAQNGLPEIANAGEEAKQVLTPEQTALYEQGHAEDEASGAAMPGAVMITRSVELHEDPPAK